MSGDAGWLKKKPRRLGVDGPACSRVGRLGLFETMPAGLLTATTRAGRTDLLTVPPHTSEPAARAAFFFSSRRRHTRLTCDWSSDVCSSDLRALVLARRIPDGNERWELRDLLD